jgi:hypothetical protein
MLEVCNFLQVNHIRESITILARDSVAMGLPQPHLNRTNLCNLPDSQLNAPYIESRELLREHLRASARPKALRGVPLTGSGAADLVVAVVDALNSRNMPTSGSMLEAFNQQLLYELVEQHAHAMEGLHLPVAVVCDC